MSKPHIGLMATLDERIEEGGLVLDAVETVEEVETAEEVVENEEVETAEEVVENEEVETAEEVVETSLEDLTKLEDGGEEEGEEEKITDDDEEEVPDEVKDQGEKATARWKELKAAEKENISLKERVQELESSGGSSDKLKALEAKIAEQDKIIAAVQVTESEAYNREVREPMARVEQEAMSFADGDESLQTDIIEALADTNLTSRARKLSDITDDMPDFLKHKLYSLAEQVDGLFAKDAAFRSDSVKAKEALDFKNLAARGEQTAEEKRALEAASDTVKRNILQKVPGLTDDSGDILPEFEEAFNKGRGADLSAAALGTKAFAAIATHLVPVLVSKQAQERAASQKRISELEKSVARLSGSGTGKGKGSGSGSQTKAGRSDSFKSGSSMLDSIDQAFESGEVTFGG